MLLQYIKKIKELTNTQFEKVELYEDIMIKQIEKMYISSEIDEKSKDLRSKFQIFPIIFLYKILLELGKGTGKYEISYDEYRYFPACFARHANGDGGRGHRQ